MRRWLRLVSRSVVASLLLVPAFPQVGSAADKPQARDDSKVEIVPRAKRGEVVSPDAPRGNIRVDSTLVLIPVTVTDPLNRFVTGLDRENFRIFEDKNEQKVTHFASEDAPLSVGVVFDTSGSMGSKLDKSRQAVSQFFKTANPEDEFFLVQFNDRPEMVVDFTTHLEEIQNRLTFTQSKGRTALLDAVYLALHNMKRRRTRARPCSLFRTAAITAAVIQKVRSRVWCAKRMYRSTRSASSSLWRVAGAHPRSCLDRAC